MFGKTNSTLTERDVSRRLERCQGPGHRPRSGRSGNDQGYQDRRRQGGADGQPDDPSLPTQGADRARRTDARSRAGWPGEWDITITMGAEVRGKGITETGDIPGIKNVIAVGSGKGGVGKSTMAAAIAFGLRSYGAKVGLMDADVYGPSIPHLVGASGRPMARGERIQPIEAEWPQADVDGLLARARQRGHHARADASWDHAAVPPAGRLGSRSTTW